MKKDKTRDLFIEQLRKIPIVQIACEKTGLSRNSVYRWRKEDEQFRKDWDESISEGELLVNDMGESQLISLIKEKNWFAISFWLRHHHPKYAHKLLIDAVINNQDEPLSPEQEQLVREALRLASTNNGNIPSDSNEPTNELSQPDIAGVSGGDDQGKEGPSGNH